MKLQGVSKKTEADGKSALQEQKRVGDIDVRLVIAVVGAIYIVTRVAD